MTQRNFNPNSPFFHEERHASLALFADRLIIICGAGTLGGNLVKHCTHGIFTLDTH